MPLQRSAGNVNAYQGSMIRIEFLQGLDASATSAFSLRGINHLPRLGVLLLDPNYPIRKSKISPRRGRSDCSGIPRPPEMSSCSEQRRPIPRPIPGPEMAAAIAALDLRSIVQKEQAVFSFRASSNQITRPFHFSGELNSSLRPKN